MRSMNLPALGHVVKRHKVVVAFTCGALATTMVGIGPFWLVAGTAGVLYAAYRKGAADTVDSKKGTLESDVDGE